MALIDEETALKIVRDHAAREGWPFEEPIEVRPGHQRGTPALEVITSFFTMGGNGHYFIDAKTARSCLPFELKPLFS